MTEFIFSGSKITVDGDCYHEIHLFPGRKAMRNPDTELRSRDITLLPKIKAIIFPVVMYRYESWIIKQVECQRIVVLEIFRVPWTGRRSNQSILKKINPEYSLEGLLLKQKLQYFDHLVQRTDPLEKTLMLGKIEGKG